MVVFGQELGDDNSGRADLISSNGAVVGAFTLTRVTMALVILGTLLIGGLSADGSANMAVQLAAAIAAVCAIFVALGTLIRRSDTQQLSMRKAWRLIALDSILAIGVMSVVDTETTPLAWVALVTPVAETAMLFSVVSAGMVWLGLSLAFLALQLTTTMSGDVSSATLVISIQQVLAVLLVAGPASLMADSAEQRIAHLADERRSADQTSERLRTVAESARQMSQDKTIDGILCIASKTAASIGFDQADVVVRDQSGILRVHCIDSNGQAVSISPEILGATNDTDIVPVFQSDSTHGEELGLARFRSGYGILISPTSVETDSTAVLRVWKKEKGASPADLRALSLVAGHARETYRSTELLREAQAHTEKLRHEVRHDGLTGLANRSFVLETLEERLEISEPMALLFIDLDGFKQLNDVRGHRAGDSALVEVGARLLAAKRDRALVGRMGGDEFVLLTPLTVFDSVESLEIYGDDIAASLSEPIVNNGETMRLGASIGIAVHDGTSNPDQFISAADAAMYIAKRSGGGTVVSEESAEMLAQRHVS